MKFYLFEVDAAGSFGDNTVYVGDPKSRPLVISHLHYEFSLWPEDELQCTLSHYIGTERLRQALEALQPPVTGIEFADVEISGDEDEFERMERQGRPDSALGKWYWFKIIGRAGLDDFAVGLTRRLVISERVASIMLEKSMVHNPERQIQPWQGEIEAGRVPQKGMPAGGES
jgi:hypothetical protein